MQVDRREQLAGRGGLGSRGVASGVELGGRGSSVALD